jgi:hypothetical protein
MQWKGVKDQEHVKDVCVIVNGAGDNIFGYVMFVINMKSDTAFILRHQAPQICEMLHPHLQHIHHKYEIFFDIFSPLIFLI